MLFNKDEVYTNMFLMADDVYNLVEIFNEAASLEARIIKRVEAMLVVWDVAVSLLVLITLTLTFYKILRRNFVKSGSSDPPQNQAMDRGSKENFRDPEEEVQDIQDQTVPIPRNSESESKSTEDEVTVMSPEEENYSANMIGTAEWAAKYLATGGPRHSQLQPRCI
ncbi:uncharacterized protein [Drosophila pseudoobscura]|uniref:Uncharacterized protein n=1 Tax=Drosophila pseudoobscura pseudoobscura TaxID=46245 RepID=B5DN87_DROPS|nr:uncharacterized protein LOC6901596 [Drosophila pseudoobscura]